MDKKVDAVSARQGRRGRPVFTILAISLGLALVAFVGYLTWVGQTIP